MNWAASLGIGAQTVALNLNSASGGLSQNDSVSNVTSINANGTPSGTLTSVQVDQSGNVTAVFSNGVTRKIAQVAIATFANPNGLTAVSGDAYQVSLASGNYNSEGRGQRRGRHHLPLEPGNPPRSICPRSSRT